MNQKQEIEIQSQAFKFYSLIIITGLLFVILLSRLFFLQIQQGEDLKKFSDSNRLKKQLLLAPRGLIFDRNQEILAGNQKTHRLILHLSPSLSFEEGLKKVSQIIQVSQEELQKVIEKSKKRNGPFYPVTLKKKLSLMEIHKLKLLSWDHREFQVMEFEKRIYPLKENGSQLLGFIGLVSKKDLERFRKQQRILPLTDVVGKSGLEKQYDEDLKGENGFSMIEVDARNRLSGGQVLNPFNFLKIEPKKGRDLHLTIDKDLQSVALKAMKRKDSIGPRSGAVIVMKTSGEILTLLSEPGFDPGPLSSHIDRDLWEKWSAKGSKRFINKGLQEPYSPGSVFKPFIALAALQEGLISKESLIDSPGILKIGSRTYHDHQRAGHGKINVITAIEKSANAFFYQLADQMGIETINSYTKLFGFGQKTQIEIPGENPGLLPSPSWKKRVQNKSWQRGDTINISIGQGEVLSTLIQLTVAYNAIATEGLIVRPFLVQKEASSGNSKILDSLTDKIQRKHFQTIKEALRKVLEGEEGTARWYQIPSLSFSGKTGTAQVISLSRQELYKNCHELPKKYRHHGWFLSFAPSEKPEIVVAVFTEHSCSGSSGSAPVARDIIQHYFQKRDSR